jgi:hypothetical protein
MAGQVSANANGIVKTDLGHHWCDMLLLVSAEDRGRAVELMALICAEHGKELMRAENRGYREGKEAVSEQERQQGYNEGWSAAVGEIMGKCGSPARAQFDPMASPSERLPS